MKTQSSSAEKDYRTHDAEFSFSEVPAIILRGRWIFLATFAGIACLTVILIALMEPVYEASASLLINTRYADSPTPLFVDPVRANQFQGTSQNELERLKSRSLADTVINRLIRRKFLDATKRTPIQVIHSSSQTDSTWPLVAHEEIVKRLDRCMHFDAVRESDVIRITAKSNNPNEAALLANTYAQAYHDRSLSASRSKSKSIREYLETQVKDKQTELAVIEDSLKRYMEEKGVVSLDDEAKLVIEQLSQLKATRDAVDMNIMTLQQTLFSYQDQLSDQERDVAAVIGESNDPYIRLLQEQLAKLEVQRDFTASQNPKLVGQDIYTLKIKETDDQISSLRNKLKLRTSQFLKTILPSQEGGAREDPAGYMKQIKQKLLETSIDIQAQKAKRSALEEPIRQYEGQFGRIPNKSMHFARLQRDKQSIEKLYLLINEKYNQVSLVEHSEFGSVEIFDLAIVPSEPSSPKILTMLVLGGFLGLGVGTLVVFVRERLSPKIHTPEDLKGRGYSVLSVVGTMRTEINRLGVQKLVTSSGRSIDPHLLALIAPNSVVSESYRQLRTNLHLTRAERPIRTIMVTSAGIGEGKSTTIANLAIAIARERKKVLLVDADLRKPMLHTYFDIPRAPGLSEYLLGNKQEELTFHKCAGLALNIVPCGKLPPNPSELLGSSEMKTLVDQMKKDYDVVLFDSSPVLPVTDPCVLASLVDEVILVVSAGVTFVHDLERAGELLGEVCHGKPGVLLNNFEPRLAYGLAPPGSAYGHYRQFDAYLQQEKEGRRPRRGTRS